jgi:hypothetical protein
MPNERSMSGPRQRGNVVGGLARTYRLRLAEVQTMEGYTDGPTVPILKEADTLALFARYGIGDMVGIEGTEDRIMRLSPRSDVACPMHEFRLVPDACRSCRFLAGEVA